MSASTRSNGTSLLLLSLLAVACGNPPAKEIARQLVHEPKPRRDVVALAISAEDRVIPFLSEETKGFTEVDGVAASRLVEVLSRVRSGAAEDVVQQMASKRQLGPRLVAAAVRARRGRPVDSMREELRRVIEGRFTPDELQAVTFGDGDEKGVLENILFLYQRLALQALGSLRNAPETDAVAKLLVDPAAKPVHGAAAEALGRTGGADAIRVLEAAMRSPTFGDTRAGFRALVQAKSPNAIPLAISRLDPDVEAATGGWLVPELEQVTGQQLGDDPNRWRAWWESAQGS